jgi:hypothetical protein
MRWRMDKADFFRYRDPSQFARAGAEAVTSTRPAAVGSL